MHTPSTPDRNPHPSVQTWSRGPIFPGVIAVIETYTTGRYPPEAETPEDRLSTEYELTYPGREPKRYATRDEAEQTAISYGRIDAWRGHHEAVANARNVGLPMFFPVQERRPVIWDGYGY